MQLSCTEIQTAVAKAVIQRFPEERIICLLRYGPASTLGGGLPDDFDFLLLLDTFDPEDCSRIQGLNLPIEIFIEYKSHIELRGIQNYKRGCHGVYFIRILASAQVLLGSNYYATLIEGLSEQKEYRDLLDRIEEYFYRIQKLALNATSDTEKRVAKYLARIVTDILLINRDLTYEDMHRLHYSDIIQTIVAGTSVFSEGQKSILIEYFRQTNKTQQSSSEVTSVLYQTFTSLLIRHHEKYPQNN